MTTAWRQRDIDVSAQACTPAAILLAAVTGRVAAVLVQGNRQHIGSFFEDRLRAVAVVHIPVDHGDFAQPVAGLGGLDGNGDVGEKAKAHGAVCQAVMPRWPRQRIGVVHLALEHRVHGGQGQTGGQLRDLIAARSYRCLGAKLTAAGIAQCLETLQVITAVDAQQVLFTGGRRAMLVQVATESGDIQQAFQAPLGLR